jgi:hypothetical protein
MPNRLANNQRRALEMLARVPRGLTEAAMLPNGFATDLLAGLVLAGLAIMATESVRAGGPTIRPNDSGSRTQGDRRAAVLTRLVRVILPQAANQVAISPGSAYRMRSLAVANGRPWLRDRIVLPPPKEKERFMPGCSLDTSSYR